MADAAVPEAPQDRQLADAQANADHAVQRFDAACEAMHNARGAYTLARAKDPASQDANQARHGWTQAAHDLVDAQAAMEKARDELTAIHRQTTETPTNA